MCYHGSKKMRTFKDPSFLSGDHKISKKKFQEFLLSLEVTRGSQKKNFKNPSFFSGKVTIDGYKK